MRTSACFFLIAVLLQGVAGSAAAQTMYKSTDRDGHVVYSDKPSPNAVKVEELQPVPVEPRSPARAAAEDAKLRKESEDLKKRTRARAAAWDEAQEEIASAAEALQKAQARRAAGVVPESGDVMATVKGTRGTAAFQERLQALDRDVEKAQQRLDKAYSARNELR